jgi:hypothetical protein
VARSLEFQTTFLGRSKQFLSSAPRFMKLARPSYLCPAWAALLSAHAAPSKLPLVCIFKAHFSLIAHAYTSTSSPSSVKKKVIAHLFFAFLFF